MVVSGCVLEHGVMHTCASSTECLICSVCYTFNGFLVMNNIGILLIFITHGNMCNLVGMLRMCMYVSVYVCTYVCMCLYACILVLVCMCTCT